MPSDDTTGRSHLSGEMTADRKRSVSPRYLEVAGLYGLAVIGVVVRLRQYFFQRSLWLDEAILANNIVDRSMIDLLADPLNGNQVAPAGFLAIEWTSVRLLGESELALRLLPLLAGIATVVVAVALARRIFTTATARITFVALVALSPVLVYYSNEVKQYGVDAFATVLLLWLFLSVDQRQQGLPLLIAVGTAVVWFSHASVFLLAGIGAVLAWRWLSEGRVRRTALLTGLWGGSALTMLLLTPRDPAASAALQLYWQPAFAPFPVDSIAELRWYSDSVFGLVHLTWLESGVPPLALESVPSGTFLLAALGLIGGVLLMRRRPSLGIALATTVLAALIASGLGEYPFRSRAVLFLVPVLLLLSAEPIEWLSRRETRVSRLLAYTLAIGLLLIPSASVFRLFVAPVDGYDLEGALLFVSSNRDPEDAIVVSAWSAPAFRFYHDEYGLEGQPDALLPPSNDAGEIGRGDTSRLGRTWFLFSHRIDEAEAFATELSRRTPLLTSWTGEGARVYLFDLSDLPAGSTGASSPDSFAHGSAAYKA